MTFVSINRCSYLRSTIGPTELDVKKTASRGGSHLPIKPAWSGGLPRCVQLTATGAGGGLGRCRGRLTKCKRISANVRSPRFDLEITGEA
jgi:hypothetical protein